MFLCACAVLAFDDMRSASPRGVYFALFQQKALEKIVFAPDYYILAFALFNREDRWQRIAFDANSCDSFAKFLLIGVWQQNHRLIAVIYLLMSQAWLVREDQLDVVLSGNVCGGNNRELTPVDVLVKCDRADDAARNRTPDCSAVAHALALHIVNVTGAPQQFVHAFLTGDRGSYDAGFRARIHGKGSRFQQIGRAHV